MPLHTAMISLNHHPLYVLIANDHRSRYQGLSDRNTLSPFNGMLFQFKQPGYYGMVMRRMRFPLDVAWFLQDQVVDSRANIPLEPNTPNQQLTVYRPHQPANSFLELPAGTLASLQESVTLPR